MIAIIKSLHFISVQSLLLNPKVLTYFWELTINIHKHCTSTPLLFEASPSSDESDEEASSSAS